MSRSRSRSRSKSPDRSRRRRSPSPRRRRSPSPRRRSPSPKVRRRSRSRSRSASPSKFTKSAPILEAWTVVRRDPSNFDAWTRLITLAESSTELDLIKNVYDRFLDKYPFCYGYWQKYADIYRRINEAVQAVQVYERGLNKIPLSIDLWSSFLTFMKGMAAVSAHTIETASSKIDSLYDKALGLVRYDYNSDRLWNEAIAWHESRGNWKKVCEIYDDLIKIPTAQFKSHFDRYMTIINLYEPDILLDDEEYENILEKLKKRTGLTIDQLITEETIVQEGLPATPGDEAKTTVITRKKHSPEALVFFRDEMKDKRIRWHEKTSSMIATRFPYEEQIKRPYFHVKELEISQLKNWREYLDFEILEGDEERINTLFSRCMIACALYDTMWLKYARWAGKRRGSSEQRSILEKGRIHCPKSINITIAHSALEESKGDYEEALAILSSFERRNPGYAAIAMRKIGVSRRKAAKEKNPDYGEVIQLWENLIHSPGTSRHLSSFYSIKLARFHLKCRNDRRLASKVLRTAIDRDRDNLQLHLQLIDLAYSEPIFCVKKVLEAFDDALAAKLEIADRLRLSQRKLDLLEDIGEDIDVLQEHMESHQQLIKEAENPSIHTRKRRSEREDRRDRDRDRDRRRDDRRERDGRNDRDGYAGGGQTMGYFAPPPQTQGMYDYGTANYNYVPQPQFY